MQQLISKQIAFRTVPRLSCLGAFVIFCFTSAGLAQVPLAHPVAANPDVTVILDDLKSSVNQTSSGALGFSSDAKGTFSTSAASRLIGYAQGDLSQDSRKKKKVPVPEANAAFSWAIDLAGVAGLAFCLRRRSQV
jgi:hypothetical protein